MERSKSEIREADYRWALKGWMETDGYDTLVFCEDTDADLTALQAYAESLNRHKHRLIFLSCGYGKVTEGAQHGKGYAEMQTIGHVLDAMPELSPDQIIVKCNGRYRARNAAKVFAGMQQMPAEIYCSFLRKLRRADSRFFGMKKRCIEQSLLPRKNEINDHNDSYFEDVLADAAHEILLQGGTWEPLPDDPMLYGHSGTMNTPFGFSLVSRMRTRLRHRIIELAF